MLTASGQSPTDSIGKVVEHGPTIGETVRKQSLSQALQTSAQLKYSTCSANAENTA